MGNRSSDLLKDLLRSVSRSFYLTLRVLPAAVRDQIGLAYLLARASDTIADTDAVSRNERLETLHAFRAKVAGRSSAALRLETLAGQQTSPSERTLLCRVDEAIDLLESFEASDRVLVREVLAIITQGQVLDVERFANANVEDLVALETDQQLDEYTYSVAGAVGEFWTRMCRKHLFPKAPLDDSFLLTNGVRFGKGLQLINIFRDLPADLRQGRCYVPLQRLRQEGLRPSDLLDARNESRFRGLYVSYLAQAEEHLEAGWAYTNHLPRGHIRVRLACAWPILIGIKTITKLRISPVLLSEKPVKISRKEVRSILFQTLIQYPWPRRWSQLLETLRAPNAKHVA